MEEEGLGEDVPASALTGGVAVIGAILRSLLSDDCKKKECTGELPKQGHTQHQPGEMLPHLCHLLLSPPSPSSALAPSTLPGSCSRHCCHQLGWDVVLGHSGLPGAKANVKLRYQEGKSIKWGLTKKQNITTNVVSISRSHPCMRESWKCDFFLPREAHLQSTTGREYWADKPGWADQTASFTLLYSKHLSQELGTMLQKQHSRAF